MEAATAARDARDDAPDDEPGTPTRHMTGVAAEPEPARATGPRTYTVLATTDGTNWRVLGEYPGMTPAEARAAAVTDEHIAHIGKGNVVELAAVTRWQPNPLAVEQPPPIIRA